jgi:hypothetical protein
VGGKHHASVALPPGKTRYPLYRRLGGPQGSYEAKVLHILSIYLYTNVYSLNFADDQVSIAQDHDDMEFMARKLKEVCEKWGLTINLEKNQIYM